VHFACNTLHTVYSITFCCDDSNTKFAENFLKPTRK